MVDPQQVTKWSRDEVLRVRNPGIPDLGLGTTCIHILAQRLGRGSMLLLRPSKGRSSQMHAGGPNRSHSCYGDLCLFLRIGIR